MRLLSAFAATIALALAGCVSTDHATMVDAAAPRFDPLAFFTGRLQGEGRLKVVLRPRRSVEVASRGSRAGDAIEVDQRVAVEGKAPYNRRWRIRETAPGRYAGTLSDAAGPVTGEVRGNLLHLTFALKGGLHADQWLALSRDGGTAHNVLVARKFGLPVARLDETIRRVE